MAQLPTGPSGAPPRLFISYARPDRDQVEQLAHALEQGGFTVWWDAALEGGHHFAAEIERELHAADAVIVVWSEASVASNWVLDEATVGRDRGCLVPVSFDGTQPPLGFRQIQSINLAPEPLAVDAIGRAVARIGGLPMAEPGRHPRTAQRTPAPKREKKPAWVPFAWAIFGVVVWLISYGMYG